MPAPRPSRAVIRNAIEAAQACGLPIGAVEITRDGSVRILASAESPSVSSRGDDGGNTCDGLFGEASG